jgi:glutamate synthase (NADPH) GltB1 subunit (EC 1.4.1.13)/glutamate synthase (NADPH) GltB3 subunit (EC 1.4.1.13)
MSIELSPSGCGVLGVLRRHNAPKIKGEAVARAIERVRYRGSDRGAGFAVFNRDFGNAYVFKVFYQGSPESLRELLEAEGIKVANSSVREIAGGVCDCEFKITLGNVADGKKAFRTVNEILWKVNRRGRILQFR